MKGIVSVGPEFFEPMTGRSLGNGSNLIRLLLDTHTFLWWLAGDRKLSAGARKAIGDDSGPVFVSAASVWEISTKHRSGKLPGASAIAGDLAGAIESQGFVGMAITIDMRKRQAPCRVRTAIRSTGC